MDGKERKGWMRETEGMKDRKDLEKEKESLERKRK